MTRKIDSILKQNYGNPIGGKGSTHWYINDIVKQQLLEAILDGLPKEKETGLNEKKAEYNYYAPGWKLYNQAIDECKEAINKLFNNEEVNKE